MVRVLRLGPPRPEGFQAIGVQQPPEGLARQPRGILHGDALRQARQHGPAEVLQGRRVGRHHHALRHRRGAGAGRTVEALHLDLAQAAAGGGLQPGIRAEGGDLDAVLSAGIQQRGPRPRRDAAAIHPQADEGSVHRLVS